MRIWTAIDVLGGKCFLLSQGDFQSEEVYGRNPADMALRWEAEGAEGLHVVDLDRATGGNSINREAIAKIAREVNIDLQVVGGIRDEQTIQDYLSMGIKRVALGTSTVKNFDWFQRMTEKYPDQLVVTIDVRDQSVFTDGWQNDSGISALEHATRVAELPIAGIIYTDITACGMQSGAGLDVLRQFRANISAPVIAAGGISSAENIAELAAIEMDGCVIGKAIYEGKLTLTAAIAAASAAHVH